MFLWVHLQIEHICQEKTEPAIRNSLKRLPKDLKATYSVIWDRIQVDAEDNRRLAERILKWIICAISPLTVKETINALSITLMQWVKRPDHDCVTDTTIIDVCRNLVVLDKELGVFRTAHLSVAEFLLEKLDIGEAHTAAAEVCLTLLCSENHFNSSRQTETEKYVPNDYALGHYSMKHWAEHCLSGGGSSTLAELQILFFKPSPAYSRWLLAASQRDHHLDSYTGRQLNPLWVACYLRLWDIFKHLLLGNPDYTMRNCYGKMPIHLIARHGYIEGVKFLLDQEGVDLNAKDDSGRTPLYFAASKGHEEVLRLLLEQEDVDLDATNHNGQTPLYVAARKGHEVVVRLLLEQEFVDLNAQDSGGETPLYAAVCEGHEATVRLLLEHEGVYLNIKCDVNWTPLHVAARMGHSAVVRLLLKQEGVDLNAKGFCSRTPLFVAAHHGHEAVVRLLLGQEGVDVNAKHNFRGRWTPLYVVAWEGHEAVVRLLLEREDVDLNTKADHGWIPLFIATSKGHEAVVRLLLEQEGVDLNAKDDFGWTLRDISEMRGSGKITRLLSDINQRY